MALVNKEPHITPEMIAAWNAGGGSPSNMKSVTFAHSDFTYDQANNRYRASATLTQTEADTIFAAPKMCVNLMGSSSASSKAQLASAVSVADTNKNEVMASYSPYYTATENYYAVAGVNKGSKSIYLNISPTYFNMNWTFWVDVYSI